MAKTYALTIAHRLGRARARTRLEEALGYAQAQVAPYATHSSHAWSGDDLSFTVTAMGATASGTASVGDSAVSVNVRLPIMMAAFFPMIRSYVEGNGKAFFAEAETDGAAGRR